MSFFSRIDRHQRLFTRMAETQGVDVDLEMQKAALSPEAYRGAVLSCTGCSQPDRCEAALNRGENEMPDYCRNTELLERLKPE